jgi:hypothetical protein
MSNRIREAFDDIHAEKELKEHTKEYLRRNVYQKKRTLWTAPVRAAAAAVCLFLVVLAGGSWLYLTPTAYISVDINPSLELGVNRFDRIVSVEGFNDDGVRLAEQLDIKYMEYNDALEQILSDQSVEEYLARSDLISITVVCDNEAKNSEMMEQVENCSSFHSSVSCHSGSTEEMHGAHEAGLSFGKYRAYLELKELDPEITPDDIRDLSMREIQDMIDSLSGEGSASSDENTDMQDSTGVPDEMDGDSGHHAEEHEGGLENRHRHNR